MVVITDEEFISGKVFGMDDDIKALRERIITLEYIVYRLIKKHPDVANLNCAGCTYLHYGRSYGVGHSGEVNPMCGLEKWFGNAGNVPNGCYYWRLRGDE